MNSFHLRTALLAILLLGLMLKVSAQSASITEGCAPLQVQFSPPAGVNAFFWDFKNGNNSILSNPTATFTTPGTYVVEFSPGNGLPVLGTVTVNVYPKPVVSYVTDTTIGCKPLTVNFENASTVDPNVPITQTTWVFGDGGSAVDVNTISHTYTTGGTFTVSLQLESSLQGCTAIAQTPGLIQVSSIPNLAFTTQPNPAVICSAPAQVSFINQTPGSGLVFEWDFGNGQTFIGRTPPPVNYAVEGTYTVSLTAIDFIGCPETITHQVRVGPPHANFMIRDTLCWKDTTLFENLSDPGFYEWNFGPNANPSTSNEANPIVIFTEPGFVDINLKVTSADGACSADTTISVYIEKPDASFALDPAYTCTTPTTFTFNPVNENAAEYIWFFNDFSKAFDVHPTWTYDAGDDPYIEKGQDVIFTALVIRTPAGCMDTLARYDTIHTAYANFMPDVINGCAPLAVTFSDSSSSREPIIRYSYLYGDGNSEDLTTDDPHTHTFTQPGEYDVRLIIDRGPSAVTVSFLAEPARIVIDSKNTTGIGPGIGGGVVISSQSILDAKSGADGEVVVISGWARLANGLGEIAFRNAPAEGDEPGTALAREVVFSGTASYGTVERSWYFYRTELAGGEVWSPFRFQISSLTSGTYELFMGLGGEGNIPADIESPGIYQILVVD